MPYAAKRVRGNKAPANTRFEDGVQTSARKIIHVIPKDVLHLIRMHDEVKQHGPDLYAEHVSVRVPFIRTPIGSSWYLAEYPIGNGIRCLIPGATALLQQSLNDIA